MAEFTEVMRQAQRMCDEIDDCDECPLMSEGGCKITLATRTPRFDEVERIVMQWAAEHPEPKYPTWYAMWKQLFPTAECVPCIKVAIGNEYKPKEGCDAIRCDVCKMRRIPADIAKKLNIQPIAREPIAWEDDE